MTARIHRINPSQDRYRANAKSLLAQVCDSIEEIDNRVSGFVVMVWDDAGATSISSKAGGIVSSDALHLHVRNQLTRILGR